MSPTARDEAFMREALDLAERARSAGEVPIGAVVVAEGEVVGRGFNAPIGTLDPTAHAEVRALREASAVLGLPRLPGTTVYVTLEPCLMCFGALVHARVGRLVFGAPDPKVGATALPGALPRGRFGLNHDIAVEGGLLADEAGALLRTFFARRRGAGNAGSPFGRRRGR